MERLAKDREYFDAVKTPTLVHWDMWEGNIFIKDGTITGIIDWERAMWRKPLWMGCIVGLSHYLKKFGRNDWGCDFHGEREVLRNG